MHDFKRALAALALLLAACSPSMLAQRPTPTPTPESMATSDSTTTEAAPATETVSSTGVATASLQTTPGSTTATLSPTAAAAQAPAQTPAIPVTNTTAAIGATATTSPIATQSQAGTQAGAYEHLAAPVDLLASYFNAVELQEYERAYSYWQQPPLDFEAFARGYADTAAVQLIVQPPTRIEGAAGSLYAEIPTFLVAQHRDGSVHSFAGCMVTRRSNLAQSATGEAEVWHIYQARLAEVPNNSNIPALLASACAN